jgi:hypothetical protein
MQPCFPAPAGFAGLIPEAPATRGADTPHAHPRKSRGAAAAEDTATSAPDSRGARARGWAWEAGALLACGVRARSPSPRALTGRPAPARVTRGEPASERTGRRAGGREGTRGWGRGTGGARAAAAEPEPELGEGGCGPGGDSSRRRWWRWR